MDQNPLNDRAYKKAYTAAYQRIVDQLDQQTARADTYNILAILLFILWIITSATFAYTAGTWS
jgi:hypothetical protein